MGHTTDGGQRVKTGSSSVFCTDLEDAIPAGEQLGRTSETQYQWDHLGCTFGFVFFALTRPREAEAAYTAERFSVVGVCARCASCAVSLALSLITTE